MQRDTLLPADVDARSVSVLFWLPRGASIPGGHLIQLRETASAVEQLGVRVRIELSENADLAEVDVVHGFGLSAGEIHCCRQVGKRVALSTIYWDRRYRKGGPDRPVRLREMLGRVKRSVKLGQKALSGEAGRIEACWDAVSTETDLAASYAAADILLPNAEGEAASLRIDLGVSTPMTVVPNGVDPAAFPLGEGPRDGLLCVGRVEPHKNQLGLIKALQGFGERLTIAGPPHPHHLDYFAACEKAGRGWVTFTGPLTHAELAPLYRSARAHLLPTWFETTGLVSLEAALSGCEIVTTNRGHAAEYFEDLASFCDPGDPPSIVAATRDALQHSNRNSALRDRITSRYTWAHTADATAAAYADLLLR